MNEMKTGRAEASRTLRWVVTAGTLCCGLAGGAASLRAQVAEFGVGAGIAVPVSEINTRQGPGLHLLGYAGYRLTPGLQVRGELSLVNLSGKAYEDGSGPAGESRPGLRVTGAGAALVYAPRGAGPGVYGLFGAGMYALSAGGQADPRGLVPGISAGVGANFGLGGLSLFAQGRAEVPFSSFASGTESAPNAYLPITAGVRVPCCGRRPGP